MFLLAALTPGPLPVATIFDLAARKQISTRVLLHATADMGVVVCKMGPGWHMALPARPSVSRGGLTATDLSPEALDPPF